MKIFFNGERLRDVYPYATKMDMFRWRMRKAIKWTFKITSLSLAGTVVVCSSFILGAYLTPKTIHAEAVKIIPPVLKRIAYCESGNNHFGKSGQVLAVGNTNKSVDVGRYQINVSVWGEIATAKGFNLFTEQGNEDMALWIYENRGTVDWYASAKCWNK